MAATFSVSTKITAIDAATAIVNRVRQSFEQLSVPVKGFVGTLGKTDSTTVLGRLGGMVDRLQGRFQGLVRRALEFAPALGAIGAIGSTMGLFKLTKDYASMADALGTTAQKTGLTVEQLQELRFAAKLANVEGETLDKGLVKLNKTLFDAATGKNKDAAAFFARVGISLRDSKGNIRSAADIMPQLAEAFSKGKDQASLVAAATMLFGKAGAELIPLLAQGRKGYIEATEAARRHGLVTDEQVKSAGELDDAMDHLGAAGAGLGNRIAAALVPTLLPLIKRLTDWVDANRELIGQAVERKVTAIAGAIETVATGVSKFMKLPIVDSFMKSAEGGKAFDVVMIALGATLAGPVLTAIHLVGKAFLLNPIGLAVAAIAALVYIIYDNWGSIVQWFEDKIARVKQAFDKGLLEGIKTVLIEFSPVRLLADAINGLSKYLFGVDLYAEGAKILNSLTRGITEKLAGIEAAFDQGFVKGVQKILEEFNPARWVAVKVNELSSYLFGMNLAEAGRKMLQSLIDGIKSILPDLTAIIQPVKDAVGWIDRQWGTVKRGADTVLAAGSTAIDRVGGGATGLVQPGAGGPQRIEGQIKTIIEVKAPPGMASVRTESSGDVQPVTRVGPTNPVQ